MGERIGMGKHEEPRERNIIGEWESLSERIRVREWKGLGKKYWDGEMEEPEKKD